MNKSENMLRSLFAEALEITDAAQRLAFLDRACGSDTGLRRELEELLQAEASAGQFLPDQPAVTPSRVALREFMEAADGSAAVPFAPIAEKPGDRIGPYELLEKLGEGGCGVVYRAQQEMPVRRQVALKVIKLGMDTRQVIARFEAERQALAMMDHPNIAKVFDAGATEGRARHSVRAGPESVESSAQGTDAHLPAGRPFFVMELVRGDKITDYCDQHQLSTRDRLELFIQVCQAVQHAHQKGVIHRDLKPSNILVTEYELGSAPVVPLSPRGTSGERAGERGASKSTSPPSAGEEGEAFVPVPKVIDFGIAKATQGKLTDQTLFTAFEQFLGTPAYMSPEQAAMTNVDIDTRSDIYSLGVLLYELLTDSTPFDTKELLALGVDELRRTIREKDPLRPSTRLARERTAAKKVGRATPCGPSVEQRYPEDDALGVTRPTAESTIRNPQSTIDSDLDWIVMKCLEKDRARRYETASGLAADLKRHLNNEPVIARPPSRFYEFQKTVRRHKVGFAATAVVIIALSVGLSLATWGLVQERVARQAAKLEAAKSEQVAAFLKEMLEGVQPSVARGRDTKMLREILDRTANRLGNLGEQPAVEADLRATLGIVYRDVGDLANAETMLLKSLELQTKLHRGPHTEVAKSLHELARVLYLQRRDGEAAQYFQAAVTMRRKLFGEQHRDVGASLFSLAEVLRRGTARAEAEDAYRRALAIQRKLPADEQLDTAKTLTGLSVFVRAESNSLDAAEVYAREAVDIQKKLLGEEHPDMAYSLANLGYLLRLTPAKRSEGIRLLRESVAMAKKLLGDHRDTALVISLLAATVTDPAERVTLHRESLAMRRRVLGNEHMGLVDDLDELVPLLLGQGEYQEAEALAMESLTICEKNEERFPGRWRVFNAQSLLGSTLLAQQKYAEAEQFLLSGYEGLDQCRDKIPPWMRSPWEPAGRNVIRLYEAWGKPDLAAAWRAKLQLPPSGSNKTNSR